MYLLFIYRYALTTIQSSHGVPFLCIQNEFFNTRVSTPVHIQQLDSVGSCSYILSRRILLSSHVDFQVLRVRQRLDEKRCLTMTRNIFWNGRKSVEIHFTNKRVIKNVRYIEICKLSLHRTLFGIFFRLGRQRNGPVH